MDAEAVVAIVVVNWNGWQHTVRCVEALRTSEHVRWHAYVVDNASTDDSVANLEQLGPDVTLIRSDVNSGWTGGNNIAISQALANGHDHIFILNNDAFVKPDTMANLLQQYEKSKIECPIIGPVQRGEESDDYNFSGAYINPKTGIPGWKKRGSESSSKDSSLYETAYISGSAIFAHRQHFENVGLFDERFYLNFDDTDWCFRARRSGYRLLIVGDSVVDHIGSASIGGRASPLQTYFMTRNRLLFAEKHSSPGQRLRLIRNYIGMTKRFSRTKSRSAGLYEMLRASDGAAAAFRQGVVDYLARRFGDCPPIVRAWQADAARRGDDIVSEGRATPTGYSDPAPAQATEG